MAEDETAATTPPQMEEEQDSTTVQPPREEEGEDASPIRPESGEENAVRPESDAATILAVSGEENTQPQIEEEEEPPVVEEDGAATTRPESGEENAVGSESEEENIAPIEIASEEENAATVQPLSEGEKAKANRLEPIRLELPTGRVKKIMKLDRDINKINSEALHLVSCSAQLFLQFLAEGSGEAAMEKKRKIVKLEHIRTAAKRHRATRDFLVDELPVPSQPSDQKSADRSRSRPVADNPAPAGTRRIDDFFSKPATKSPIEVEES
ncbi:hypothetical protein ABKV19_015994 [Rosa sericea]